MRKIFRALSVVLLLLFIALVSALITMRLAIHGAEVRVPELSGLPLSEAATHLHARGLETGIDGHFYSTTQAPGHVLTQSPAPGTLVRKSWRVRVTVSLGPQKTAIPALEGMDESIAGITVRRVGLQLGDVSSIPYGGAPQGTVVAQTPLPKATNAEGPQVGLLIAQPITPEENARIMPDFIGEPFTAAALTIFHSGFTLVTLESSTPGARAPTSASSGTVIAQGPAAGSRIAAGATIHLTVQP